MTNEDTINLEGEAHEDRSVLRTSFQIVLNGHSHPIRHARTQIGGPGAKANDLELTDLDNRQLTLTYQGGKLFFTNHVVALTSRLNGVPSQLGELQDNDELEIGTHRLRILDTSCYPASLESYPEGLSCWVLRAEDSPVGRGGKRVNRVEIDDPTVSRVQASFLYREGRFRLLSETSGSPTRVNGFKLPEGQTTLLEDGDLVQFGKVVLRFRCAPNGQPRRELVPQEATILFSDIWNYSSLAENRPLEETILQMNEFYRGMGKVIESHGGGCS